MQARRRQSTVCLQPTLCHEARMDKHVQWCARLNRSLEDPSATVLLRAPLGPAYVLTRISPGPLSGWATRIQM